MGEDLPEYILQRGKPSILDSVAPNTIFVVKSTSALASS